MDPMAKLQLVLKKNDLKLHKIKQATQKKKHRKEVQLFDSVDSDKNEHLNPRVVCNFYFKT